MATKIMQLDTEIINKCLGANEADASGGVLFAVHDKKNRKHLSDDQRILFIGLGGQGIKTVNRIKSMVATKFEDYSKRLAFLAIDTDWDDLDRQAALKQEEKFCIRTNAAAADHYNKPHNRTEFTKSWINPEFWEDLTKPGANQVRQACRAKLFDDVAAANHNDQQITDRISDCAKRVLEAFDPTTMQMKVYIIAGVAGGTGSGSVVEMAHFVRRAIQQKHEIYGYLLLPDVVQQYHKGKSTWQNVQANGYAALKELDYYYSETQRTSKDPFNSSVPSLPTMYFDVDAPLYDMLYLISGNNGASSQDANKTAIETISEALINQLSENGAAKGAAEANKDGENAFLASSFSANLRAAREAKLPDLYDVNGQEKANVCAEDTYRYNALGVATATIPEQTVKCYAVTKILRTVFGKTDGFEPTAEFVGFASTPLTAVEAGAEIAKLIPKTPKEIEKEILRICNNLLQWPEDHQGIDRNEILANQVAPLATELQITTKKGKAIAAINAFLQNAYDDYRSALRAFLEKFGPMAYRYMLEGVDPTGGNYKDSLKNKLYEYTQFNVTNLASINTNRTAGDQKAEYERVHQPILGARSTVINAWHEAYRANQVAEMAQEIAGHVFGEAGVYCTMYLNKIAEASEQVKAFAFTLEQLYGIYDSMGAKFGTHEAFQKAAVKENAANMNVIEGKADFDWAKDVIKARARALDYAEVKRSLIDSFLDEPKAWTEYDSAKPQETPRRVFDSIIAPYVDMGDDLTIVSYIDHKMALGADMEETVDRIVRDLAILAKPLYNVRSDLANSAQANQHCYLMVPDAMFVREGGSQFRACFEKVCNARNVELFPCNIGDKLVYYTQYAALPLYALADLKQWESVYDSVNRQKIHANESDKGIYDPETGLRWEDYPALALVRDPRLPDEKGNISREGKFLKEKFDPLFAEALEKGIIEEEKKDGKYSYYCYVLDIPGWDYSIDLDEYTERDEDGLYMVGNAVFRYIAKKNGGSVEQVRRRIELRQQGFFNEPTENRARALDRAKRALRRNVPMFIGIKRTLKMWDSIGKELDDANNAIKRTLIARYIPYYVATGLLEPDGKKNWMLKDYGKDGKTVKICSLNPLMMDENDPLAEGGYSYEILCRAFFAKMADDTEVPTYYKEYYAVVAEEPEVYAPQFKARMDAFAAEGEKFLSVAEGTSLSAQKALMKELKLDADGFETVIRHYKSLVALYKKIESAC